MKFSLRDLFWLVLVAAMGCAWTLNHCQLEAELEALREQHKFDELIHLIQTTIVPETGSLSNTPTTLDGPSNEDP